MNHSKHGRPTRGQDGFDTERDLAALWAYLESRGFPVRPDKNSAGHPGLRSGCPICSTDGDSGKFQAHAGPDRLKVVCHGGCVDPWPAVLDILKAANPGGPVTPMRRTPKPVEPPAAPGIDQVRFRLRKGTEAAREVYAYQEADGTVYGAAIRIDLQEGGKDFRQASFDGESWTAKAPTTRLPYRLPEVLADPSPIVIVEGERVANLVRSWGFNATTWAGGTGAVRRVDWTPLEGRVGIMVPDNDPSGRQAGEVVEAALEDVLVADLAEAFDLDKGDDLADVDEDDAQDWLREQIAAAGHDADSLSLADVNPEDVEWVLPGFIPAGELTLIHGDGGVGKSTVLTDIAAKVTRGRGLVQAEGFAAESIVTEPRGVIWATVEESIPKSVRPRFDRSNADVSRVAIMGVVQDDRGERALDFREDAPRLARAIRRGKVALVIIDPISSFLGDTKDIANAEVRAALMPLAKVAHETGAAIVMVQHNAKSSEYSGQHKALGSTAFSAMARCQVAVFKPEGFAGQRAMKVVKTNLGPPAARTYSIDAGLDGNARLTWTGDRRPDDLVECVTRPRKVSGADKATEAARRLLGEANRPLLFTALRDDVIGETEVSAKVAQDAIRGLINDGDFIAGGENRARLVALADDQEALDRALNWGGK